MVVGEKGRVIVGACDKRPDTLEKPAASEFVLKAGDCAVKRLTLKRFAHLGFTSLGRLSLLLFELLLRRANCRFVSIVNSPLSIQAK